MGTPAERIEVIWRPQPGPQSRLIECPAFGVLYGGARGGGKTDGMLGDWLSHAGTYGKHANGIFFRRELTQLDEAIARSQEIYLPLGATWHEQKKQYTFPDGARLKFRYLARDSDAEAYQGHSYTRVYFEELTNFPEPKPVDKMLATLRSGAGVSCGFRATANPGGPGHTWVKARFIDRAPGGFTPWFDDEGLSWVFIPAKLQDNRILMDNDPTYIARLRQSGSEQLVRAWLEGDWSVVEGAYFDCWSLKMIVKPFKVPGHWMRFRSMDWGSARPFSIGWWATATESVKTRDGVIIPANALVRYREWYGKREPNVGLKMNAEDVARAMVTKQAKGEQIRYHVADPAMWAEDGGPSLAERCCAAAGDKVMWRRADNRRVAQKGAMGGWDQMRARMEGEDDRPMLYVFDTCADSIRTIPSLVHDEMHPEDLDTDGEDHAADEWRYACMSRPYTRPKPMAAKPMTDLSNVSLDRLWRDQEEMTL